MLGRDGGLKTGGKKGGKKGKRKVAKVTSEFAGAVGKTVHIAANCTKGSWNKRLNAGRRGDISEEVHEEEDELHAPCLLEESEIEQWQEVTSKKSKEEFGS